MNLSEPKKLAFVNAVLTSVFSMTIWLLSLYVSGLHLSPAILICSAVAVFIFVFYFFRFTLEHFIYQKIKVIYKTISKYKRQKDVVKPKLNVNGDTLENVHNEVLRWGEDHKNEIEKLEKMAGYRREFLGNISHELKTPIFNIQGYILTLLDGGLEDPSINREYLERTENSINRLITIVEDLENISNLESGSVQLKIERFDVVALAREVADYMEIKARIQGTTIFFSESYDRPVFVNADQERIRQVFVNLLDNSLKYGQKEDGKTKISFFNMDENVLVEITDNGPGIEPQDIPRIFERFYRADKARSREQGGSGLGLSIVKHIIEAHDQSIDVRSTLGIGTTFAFTLPLL
jgi:two-component system, OmpR family, phosphate regulon sensor histidine kinase PhoR